MNRIEKGTVRVYQKGFLKFESFEIEKWFRDGRKINLKEVMKGMNWKEYFEKLMKGKDSLLQFQDKVRMKAESIESKFHAGLLKDYFADWRE